MKKLFTLFALATMAIGANATTAVEAVVGTYTVHSDVNFLYVSRYNYVYTGETVTITAKDDSVSVSYTNETWGTYTATAAVTANEDGSYSLVGIGTATMAGHSGTSEYYADFEATVADAAISGTFSVESVMGGTTVTFASGDAPAFEVGQGDHTVYSDVNFLYVSRYVYTYTDETVTLSIIDADSINVAYTNDTWGTYDATGVVTANEDGSYSIVGAGTATMAGHSGTSEYYADLEATVSDGVLTSCVFSVESVMGGTTVTIAEGTAPAFEIGSGDHRGYTETLFAYISTPMCDAYDTLTVAIAGSDVLNITYTNATWGNYAVDSAVVVVNEDGNYSITGVGTATMAAHGNSADYYCELSATVDTFGIVEATFYMESVMGGTSVVFFEGSAPAYAIAGEYVGDLTGVFAYGSLDAEGDTVVIDWEDTATATVELNDSTWGYFLVEGATVTETDSTYVLSGSGTVAMDNHAGGTNDYAFDFAGTISSDLSTYTFVYTLEIMGGTTITVSNVSDDETGIQTVTVKTNTTDSSNAIYDLSGRRVDSTYKGVVIKNGKKFIQK